jgi:hypothetical protein
MTKISFLRSVKPFYWRAVYGTAEAVPYKDFVVLAPALVRAFVCCGRAKLPFGIPQGQKAVLLNTG